MEKNEYQKLTIQGTEYVTTLTTKFLNRKKWVPENPKQINSIIPGTINSLFVKPGECVKQGQKLLILEAMKMLNTMYSPFDGKIRSVNIRIGENVPKGRLLIEFD